MREKWNPKFPVSRSFEKDGGEIEKKNDPCDSLHFDPFDMYSNSALKFVLGGSLFFIRRRKRYSKEDIETSPAAIIRIDPRPREVPAPPEGESIDASLTPPSPDDTIVEKEPTENLDALSSFEDLVKSAEKVGGDDILETAPPTLEEGSTSQELSLKNEEIQV